MQILAGHMQVNKSNESYYLNDDAVIVPDNIRRSTVMKSLEVQHSKQNFAVTMADSGLKSAKRKGF
jgi:hypothetical protein